ncbi:tetratricopeptide repeat protein [Lentzea flaviverrucosa]|uniref:Tetratricopeptide repeat-containing protein n=1 Tax=Lentzea flaviverrucosa TaxID=200379 RepID=A0A1H9XIX7_9PSEU|nr:tetratricopeptide repeat protein [Lentzea flaviverrucosa]RDI20221.1 tetratricopeptide repeat protein [Lentzea flaviverrucosa]SES46001.1 Tetratricopeptide repeat-containing protein [Lentzea flaviverrucosa]
MDDDGDDPALEDSDDDPAVRNSVGDGDHGIVVQAGWIDSVHLGSAGDSAAALADPIIATVWVQPSLTSLYVDDDPPRKMASSGDVHVIHVEARTTRAVTLLGLRPVVVFRRPPRRACVEVRMGGIVTPRPFTADFDSDRPRLTALRRDFPFSVSATDVEQFHFVPHVSATEVGWRLELDWLVAGKPGTTVIDDHGKPFGLYPSQVLADESDLDWGCDMFHLPGCPAERLEALGRPVTSPPPAEERLQAIIDHAGDHEPESFRAQVLDVLDHLNASGQSELGASVARTVQRAWGSALGGNHRDTLAVANRLAGYLLKLGELQQACVLFESTYRRRVRALGADDPGTLVSAANLALSMSLLHGPSDRVRELRVDTLRRSRAVRGEDHRDTLVAAVDLGYLHLLDGDPHAARAVLADALRRAESAVGPDDPVTRRAAQGLAKAVAAIEA